MIFASYAAFRSQTLQMIDGDDVSQSDLSVQVLDLIIAAGERRIYRDVRSTTQDTLLSLTTTSNLAPYPSDFIEMRGAPYVTGFSVTTYVPWEEIQNLIQTGCNTTSHALRYSNQGDSLIFYPVQTDGTAVTGQYYKKFADISTALNAFFNRHPDLFLYASLAESAPFLGELTRLPIWEGKYQELAKSVNEEERRRQTRGSKLVTRVA